MISIVAKFKVKEEQEKLFLNLIKELGEASQAEKGCIEYILHRHSKDPQTFCLIEKWQDLAAIDKHNNTKHFTIIVPQLLELSEAEIDIYQPVKNE